MARSLRLAGLVMLVVSLSPGHAEELELDVVRIPEDDHRIRDRIAGVDHTGIGDTEAIEPARPCVEISAASDQAERFRRRFGCLQISRLGVVREWWRK